MRLDSAHSMDKSLLYVPAVKNMFFLLVPAVERSSFAVQNDVCAEFETTKLLLHSLLKVGTFLYV